MVVITIDFETYYNKEYSLSKMTTEEYIRDSRFQVICMGIKINNEPTQVYYGKQVGEHLNTINFFDKAVLCHHAQFDGAILSWVYGITPMLWLDTLSMSRPKYKLTIGGSLEKLAMATQAGYKGTEVLNAIGLRLEDFTKDNLQRYGRYCMNDVDLTYRIYRILKSQFSVNEILSISQVIDMFTNPSLEINADALKQHHSYVVEERQKLLEQFGEAEAVRKTLASNPKFAALLERIGITPPMKISKTTGKPTYALAKTDQGMQSLLDHDNPTVAALAAARLGVKSTLEETRTLSLIKVAGRGPLPVYLNYYGAHTGRMSGGDGLNLQNLPARAGKAIRQAIRAPRNCKLVVADLSQIEARLVAYIAGQDDLVQAFAEGRDTYSEFASKVYGRTITKADKVERFVGKTCILGLGYGMGPERLADTLRIGQNGISVKLPEEEAKNVVLLYREVNHMITKLWKMCNKVLKAIANGNAMEFGKMFYCDEQGIRLTNGLYIRYPALRERHGKFSYIKKPADYTKYLKSMTGNVDSFDIKYESTWGGAVTENIVQAQASILMREQMLECAKAGYPVKLQVHDEVIVCVPDSMVDKAVEDIRLIMSTPPTWAPDLPIACEVGYHQEYGSVVKK
jgi:DNA polymerase I-like protein with 3'-5' exonuclease and polymerase domains